MDHSKLPATVTGTVYICISPSFPEDVMLTCSDMSGYGYAVLGTQEVTVDVPRVYPRAKMIEGLEAQAKKLQADHQVALNDIQDKIQSLLALEHGGGE